MDKEEIIEALKAVGVELLKQGITGEVLVVGGAAMCLVHDARDTTKDVDALYEPKAEIAKAIETVAEQRGLSRDWLNDSVKGFMFTNPDRIPFTDLPGLKVTTVQSEYLFAMKLLSARTSLYETDRQDIKTLISILDIKSFEQAVAILDKFVPADRILPRTQYLLVEILQELSPNKL